MGAYFILYPQARILTLVPLLFFFTFIEVPAYVFLGFWFLMQFFNGTLSLLAHGRGFSGIAWWAHIGGFFGGMVLLRLFRGRRPCRNIPRKPTGECSRIRFKGFLFLFLNAWIYGKNPQKAVGGSGGCLPKASMRESFPV